jgi:hypothetical protein
MAYDERDHGDHGAAIVLPVMGRVVRSRTL